MASSELLLSPVKRNSLPQSHMAGRNPYRMLKCAAEDVVVPSRSTRVCFVDSEKRKHIIFFLPSLATSTTSKRDISLSHSTLALNVRFPTDQTLCSSPHLLAFRLTIIEWEIRSFPHGRTLSRTSVGRNSRRNNSTHHSHAVLTARSNIGLSSLTTQRSFRPMCTVPTEGSVRSTVSMG